MKLFRSNIESVRGLEHPHQLEILLDGEPIHVARVGGDADFAAAVENPTLAGDAVDARLQVRITVPAGPRNIGVTFVQKRGEGTRRLQPFLRSSADTFDSTGRPHVERRSQIRQRREHPLPIIEHDRGRHARSVRAS